MPLLLLVWLLFVFIVIDILLSEIGLL